MRAALIVCFIVGGLGLSTLMLVAAGAIRADTYHADGSYWVETQDARWLAVPGWAFWGVALGLVTVGLVVAAHGMRMWLFPRGDDTGVSKGASRKQ